MKTLLIVMSVVALAGCAGVYIPPCEVENGWWRSPCLGYANRHNASPLKEGIQSYHDTYWSAVLYIDENGNNQAMKVAR